jgi:hypothetical protein
MLVQPVGYDCNHALFHQWKQDFRRNFLSGELPKIFFISVLSEIMNLNKFAD